MFSVNMDASPVPSGSKCGSSDFSIKRLLSEDTKSCRDESVELPDWLCCTRYRPPRLPRATTTVCRARRAGRHARVPFTAAQASALEAAYARAPYLAPPALRALAAALQLRDDRIKIWFQNRRARERREKSVNIAPPHAISLPPTTVINTFSSNSWIPTRLTRNGSTFPAMDLRSNDTEFMHQQNIMHNYSLKEESDEDRSDDGLLDIETIEE